jgi:protein-S-isoprenylcysteine O-methyltransferase Ste14
MYDNLIGLCWFIFFIVWYIFSLKAKKTIPEKNQTERSWIRVIILITILLLFFIQATVRQLREYHLFPVNPLVQSTGIFICASGILFAIWARTHLGRNWGMPMSIKEKPDLVTSGPYYLIRHPIYTGILIAMFGCTVTAGLTWLIWLLLSTIYFIYSAKKEEKLMLRQFPEVYPAYMKRTKMLIPFIF